MKRRSLLHWIWGGVLALAAWPVLRFITWREPAVRLVSFTSEELQGGGIVYKEEVFLLTGEEPPLALSARCSHLGCLVSFDPVRNEFRCPCHHSVYDALGRRLAGPTTTGLKHLPVLVHEEGGLSVEAPL